MLPNIPVASYGRNILVALPSAMAWRVSRYLTASRSLVGLPWCMEENTVCIACASPSATVSLLYFSRVFPNIV